MARKDFYDIKGLGELREDQPVGQPPPVPPSRPYQDPGSRPRSRTLLKALLVVVIVVLLGGAAFFAGNYFQNHKTVKKPTATLKTTQPSTSSAATPGQYVSKGNDLNLSFTYPTDWEATPASGGNTNDQTITVVSPATNISAADGSSVTAKVTFTIRPGTAPLNELTANNPTAPIASTQIAYKNPTPNQNQYPFITFIHFSNGSTTPGSFEEVMITGVTHFAQNQAVTPADLTGLDPIISATFTKCTTTSCTGAGATPLSITSTTWNGAPLFQQVLAIFQSLKLN